MTSFFTIASNIRSKSSKARRSKCKEYIPSIVLLTLLATLPTGCSDKTPSSGGSRTDLPPCKASTFTVFADNTPRVVALTGVTEPIRRAIPSARLMAKVVEAGFKEGDRVEANRVLVRLDTRDLAARRRQAKAGLDAAQTGLEVAGTTRTRMQNLADAGAVPHAQLDPVQVAYAQATAAVASANAALDELDINLSYAEVHTPFTGVVVQRMTEVGNLVGPGQPLFVVEDDSQLRVIASIGADLAAALSPGQTLNVRLDGHTEAGTVEGIVSSGDARAPGLRMQLVVDNAEHRYRTGVLSVVEVPVASSEQSAITLPRAALVERGQLSGAFVVTADSTVHLRWLAVGDAQGDTIRVLSGLRPGERVILSPDRSCIFDGRRVVEER